MNEFVYKGTHFQAADIIRSSTFSFLLTMQLLTVLLASASVAHAHYNFNALTYGGTTQATWQQGMPFPLLPALLHF
jgi:hypothetical protein